MRSVFHFTTSAGVSPIVCQFSGRKAMPAVRFDINARGSPLQRTFHYLFTRLRPPRLQEGSARPMQNGISIG